VNIEIKMADGYAYLNDSANLAGLAQQLPVNKDDIIFMKVVLRTEVQGAATSRTTRRNRLLRRPSIL
jgi:hypothetical protein